MPGVTWWTSSEGGHVPSAGKEGSNTQEKPAGKAAAQFVPVAFDAISARRMRAGVWNTLRSVSTLRAFLLMRLDREIDRLHQHRRREDVGQRVTRPACA